ncbi:MAG: UxaA family hydrolase [Gammaproteobacteria bacterium]|nr:UxaA family hydrolase [Gammaproteobacteria bacterium]
MRSKDTASSVLLLDDADNVLVVIKALEAGDIVRYEGEQASVAAPLGIGHKLARRAIGKGAAVVKLGMQIGVATQDIEPLAHVHSHCLASLYTASHQRDGDNND